MVCPEGVQSCNMKNRDIYWSRYKKHWTQDNDDSVPFKIGTLGPHTALPITISCPVIFSWIPSTVWNLFPFKGDFSFGKSQKSQGPNLGCKGADSPGQFEVSQKKTARDVMHERAGCHAEAANHQLPRAVAFWIIWIVSVEDCSSFTPNVMQIHCSTHSVILNEMATHTHAHSAIFTTPTD